MNDGPAAKKHSSCAEVTESSTNKQHHLSHHQEKVLHVDMGFFLWNMHVPAPNMRF